MVTFKTVVHEYSNTCPWGPPETCKWGDWCADCGKVTLPETEQRTIIDDGPEQYPRSGTSDS